MVNPESIFTVAPELKSETEETVQFFINMAALRISPDVWKQFYDMGVTFLAAHLLTMKRRAGVAGQVTEQKVGDLSVQYANVQTGKKMDFELMSTSYGMQYLQLRGLAVVTPMAI